MQGDMIGLVALNLVLRVIRAGVMDVTLIGHIFGMHPRDPAGNPACLGIPAYVIADPEYSRHDASHLKAWCGLSCTLARDRQKIETFQRFVKQLIQMSRRCGREFA
jgi:hypothetical protein